MPGDRELPIERVEAHRIEPGDTIVAVLPDHVSLDADVHKQVHETLSKEFPDNHVVVVQGLELWVGHGGKRRG